MASSDGTPPIPVLVADDDGLVRSALAAFLDGVDGIDLVGQARNGEEAVKLALELHPRVVVMDVSMPQMDGVEATRQILAKAPNTHILMLTGHADRDLADAAMRAGAVGYVHKDREPAEIFAAILAATASW